MPEHQQMQQSRKPNFTFQKQADLTSQTHVSHPASIIQRARIDPKSLTAADVLQLQQTIGNRAVGRLLSEIRNSSKVQQAAIQRQEIPEEEKEPLQGMFGKEPEEETCPSCVQRQEKPEEEEPLQGKFETIQRLEPEDEEKLQMKSVVQRQEIPEEETLQTKRENNTGMPDNLKAGVESLSGIDMSDVRVHYNSDKPAKVGALAYTQGTNIHVAPGQEKHLPHESWHVVQQEQGHVKLTMQLMGGVPVNDDQGLENEADVMGAKAMNFKNQLILESVAGNKNANNPLYSKTNQLQAIQKKRLEEILNESPLLQQVRDFQESETLQRKETIATDPNAFIPWKEPSLDNVPISILSGLPLQLTGKKLTQMALNHLNASHKVPLGIKDPEAFLAKKRTLDAQLENDFNLIISKLDEAHYSDSDEGEVIKILRKWAEEKFVENSALYPAGGEYLDKLFTKLTQKTKDVGIVTTQMTSYYSIIFNHFDRVIEVRFIRDVYSRNFKGDNGIKELSFGSYLWEQVKERKIRDQIFAYFRGLGKGIWSGAKGTVMMAYTLVTDPKRFLNDLKNLPSALREMWEKRSDLWNKFANASPEEQAEMIGEVFGEIEFMIGSAAVGGATAKGVEKLTKIPGTVGKVTKTVQVVTKLPQTALGAVAKSVKTVVVMGVKGAAQGAKFAARGIYRVGKAFFRGTWSVVEKTVGKVTKRIYYFYDEAAAVLREIPAKFAKKCVKCSSPCKLMSEAMEVAKSAKGKVEKVPFNSKKALAELKEKRRQRFLAESKASKRPVIRTRADLRRELQQALDRATPIADRWLKNNSSYWAKVYRVGHPLPAKFASIPLPRVKAMIRGKVVHNVTEKIVRKMEIPGLMIEKRVIVSPLSGKYRIPDFFFKVGKKEYREFLDIKPKNFNFGPSKAQYKDMAKVIDEWGGEITKLRY